jgi:hypothetical protein
VAFLDEYLAGNVEAEEIHDYLDIWHDGSDNDLELHEYLGMTWEQYAVWAESGVLPERP